MAICTKVNRLRLINLYTLNTAESKPFLLLTVDRARHRINARNRDDLDLRNGAEHFVGDKGRAEFSHRDFNESDDVLFDKLEACRVLETRKDCPWSCDIYLEPTFYLEGFHGPGLLELNRLL